jgi:hypothetical protein
MLTKTYISKISKRYAGFIHTLALVLIFSAVLPCRLIEVASEAFGMDALSTVEYASERGPATGETAGDQAQLASLECCAECLACCASYTEAPALESLTLTGASIPTSFFAVQQPLEIPLTTWRPPRI